MTRKNVATAVCLATLLALPVSASSPQTTEGKVGLLQQNPGGPLRFQIIDANGAPKTLCDTVPGGQSNLLGDITLNQGTPSTTAEAKVAMLNLLLSAKLAGKTVSVIAVNRTTGDWGCMVSHVQVL